MEDFEGVIGIDLGTTYSCVGVWIDDHVEIIANDLGSRVTPSWVSFVQGERLIGEVAKQQAASNPKNTFYDVKRIIGRRYNDPNIENDFDNYAYTVSPDTNDLPVIEAEIDGQIKKFRPEEISAMVLYKMKATAEAYLGKKVKNAVITVPAYFNDAQRTATQNAAQIAGLNCLRLINEPTAAAICYGLQKNKDGHVLVYDFGGGTLDSSLLELNGGVFEVKATSGNTRLGGEDFDNRLAKHLKTVFETKHKKIIPDDNSKALRKLKDAAETVKKRLSQMQSTRVEIDSLYDNTDFSCHVNRATFEGLCMDLFKSSLEPVKQILADADLQTKDIDEIVLVGGSTRIPKIQEMLSDFFGGKKLNQSVNPDEAVAYGAAVQGAILSKSDSSGKTKGLVLVDLIPLSLGIETTGGLMSVIIPRNSSVPCEKSSLYSTIEDNQSAVLVQILEGERKFTKDNHVLATFELSGIPKAIRGVPKIEVTFKIDANGILNVTAFEKDSQVHQEVTISKDSGRLSEEEIRQMIEDADKFRASDEIKKENLEMRNSFDKYLQLSQTTINDSEFHEALTLEERSYANQLILNTQDWLTAIDVNTGEPAERTKEEVMDCKQAVEFHLKPLINKVYARQISLGTIAEPDADCGLKTAEALNEAMAECGLTPTSAKGPVIVQKATLVPETKEPIAVPSVEKLPVVSIQPQAKLANKPMTVAPPMLKKLQLKGK
jgi:heat shock protein 1/8